MIDLHSHTTASDGEHSADELMAMARRAGVTCLAVTDHDTVAGLEVARQAAQNTGISFVDGIEISAFVNGREVHILGHFVSPQDPNLRSLGQRLRGERDVRMRQMVERMNALGYPIRFEEVEALAQGGQLGRPHLARVLVEKNYCLTTKEAFDRFLADGKPAWVDRYKIEIAQAISLIRNAGGTATLAHPGVSKVNPLELETMKAAGLAGLEVFHSDHVPSLREKLLEQARRLDLIPTAGSDFHGKTVAPNRHLGTASMEPALFEALQRRAGADGF